MADNVIREKVVHLSMKVGVWVVVEALAEHRGCTPEEMLAWLVAHGLAQVDHERVVKGKRRA